MKKFSFVILAIISLFFVGCLEPTASETLLEERNDAMSIINKSIPVPKVNTAQERKMVKRRVQLFDVENKLGYVYLVADNGVCIGFYSIFGKMASLQSYMVPQEEIVRSFSGYWQMQSADLDGTYGDNMPGVFFFTDNGTYVEIPAFGGITPIYSDRPWPIKAPKFNIEIKEVN